MYLDPLVCKVAELYSSFIPEVVLSNVRLARSCANHGDTVMSNVYENETVNGYHKYIGTDLA